MKVLVVIAAPPNYPAFDTQAEWAALEQATALLREAGHLQLDRLTHATWPALRRKLRVEDYHVLHYVGYTQFDDITQQGFLALEDEGFASGSRPTGVHDLGMEIGCESTIRLIVCDSRGDSNKSSFALANQFLQSGTPAVLTKQQATPQEASLLFNREFYPPLSEGHPVEAGVNIARRALNETRYWGAWALFLRAQNGALFRRGKFAEIDD